MRFEIIDRPERNKHKLRNELNYDYDLERELLNTLITGRAIKVTLAMFHRSPAKGRLWLKHYKVRHRVLDDGEYVAAWVVPADEPEEEEDNNGEQQPELFPA